MMELISCYWPWMAGAAIIGLLTGLWAWGGSRTEDHSYDHGNTDLEPKPAPVAAPVVTPAPAPAPVPVAAPALDPAPAPAPVAAPAAAAAAVGATAAAAATGRPNIAAAVGAPDDLLLVKGIGPKLNELLLSLGVTRFDQIAKWTGGDIAEVDQYLGAFKGRIDRDAWVDQAGYLARGDFAAYEAKYGKMESK